ncbi:hypothetical protein PP175_27030 (plasmid) [Aneurinibacillus sp. Ricciae_BoGa-3]|uniref:hypothetical protein n=1 Tax=Aneurinibacillus sp. Ricciae_BoGa-3 TaxID=3022697 RepID=UPI00233FCCA6|nr:hypothetical protein [Aneurinibacillus sp. Ricciae_BoGa-3]WCK57693.1 hypothetical protein PP175_27030 [Aneurinibacillus sp. Ricciae_BoGa-3]
MNKFMNFLRKQNQGYVSIETIVIGGLVVGFGALLIGAFNQAGYIQVQNSVSTVGTKFNSLLTQ